LDATDVFTPLTREIRELTTLSGALHGVSRA
jgi:hypothetical protein